MGLAEEKVKKYLDKIEKENGKINAVLHLNPNALKEAREIDEKVSKTGKKGRLYGYVVGVKSNINVFGLICNCASKTLEDYKATYDATVIEKIKAEDGVIIGMLNMDEFACGSSGENSAFACAINPKAPERVPGGSSSGSASAVAAGFCDMALGSDTGCSIRTPASNCGIIGIKPSYGLVSRYGLIDLSMSLDQIGPLAKNADDAALLLEVISGRDEHDPVSYDMKKVDKIQKNFVLGVLDLEACGLKVDKKIQKLIDNKIEKTAEKHGWKVKKIKLKNIDLAIETYYPLVYVEFFSGTRKFDGRRFGKKIEDAAGAEVLRRVLGGSEISKAEYHGRYYHLALKVKKYLEQEFSKAFKDVDCIICPTVPRLPHKIGEEISVEEMYSYDALTIPSNLAGNCAISIPVGRIDNVPVGMQIICDKFQEQKMFGIAKEFERG